MAIPNVLLQLAKSNPMMGQIKQMMNTVKMSQNPQMVLNQLAMRNPMLKEAMDVINQYGGDVNKALKAKANEYGISEQDVMNMLK